MRTRTKINAVSYGSIGLAIAYVFVGLLLPVLCMLPRSAWAAEYDDAPVGVLTLCDNPFAIDCGHDHDSSSSALDDVDALSHSPIHCSEIGDDGGLIVQQPTITTNAAPASDVGFAADEPASLEVESIALQLTPISSSGSFGNQAPQNFCTAGASSSASILESNGMIPFASSDETRIIVEDEGLYQHEYATVLAEVRAGISRFEFDRLIDSAGGLSASSVTDDDLAYGLVRLGIIDGSSVLETIERLRGVAGFMGVQPNYFYQATGKGKAYTVLDDTYATRQWGLDEVDAYAAWDVVKVQGSVSVAVIDTGADLDHPDLEVNIVATHNSLSSANTVEDIRGHGSHVAGIISGVANNGEGVAGVSYNAGLVIIKAAPYNSTAFDTASLVRAYTWLESLDSSGTTVAEHYNVRVVNMSIAGLDDARSSNLPDDALNKVITKARDEFGLLTVVAAGNGSHSTLPYLAYPSSSEACMSVMNLCELYDDESDEVVVGVGLDSSSNYNVPGADYLDICAPGTGIYSTWTEGRYAIDSGTSMAAPMVAGIAAMLFAVNPCLTPQMVMSILEFSATDLGDEGWDERYGYGAVNAAAAVRIASASRIDGFDVVGVEGSASYTASLGLDMAEDGSGRTWRVVRGTGSAYVDENGVLTGERAGTVTLVSTAKNEAGAEISAMKTVQILEASIVGKSAFRVGSSSEPYTTTDATHTWVWQVENETGRARIDQDGVLVTEEAGVVYVTATCAGNTDIVLRRRVNIVG